LTNIVNLLEDQPSGIEEAPSLCCVNDGNGPPSQPGDPRLSIGTVCFYFALLNFLFVCLII